MVVMNTLIGSLSMPAASSMVASMVLWWKTSAVQGQRAVQIILQVIGGCESHNTPWRQ